MQRSLLCRGTIGQRIAITGLALIQLAGFSTPAPAENVFQGDEPYTCVVERLKIAYETAGPDGIDDIELSDVEAKEVWACMEPHLRAAFDKENQTSYFDWLPASSSPYFSAHTNIQLTTDNDFIVIVANYVNEKAADYLSYQAFQGTYQSGGVLVKPSLSVRDDGLVEIGGLALMEKLPEGTRPESLDWDYQLIWPSKTVSKLKLEEGAGEVQNCLDCHKTYSSRPKHVLFPPPENRINR